MLETAKPVAATAAASPIRFTIGSVVNDKAQYAEMLTSFQKHGFGLDDCEFLYVDNSAANTMCCYRGLNRMLTEARGDIVILCHQDVRLVDDGRAELEARLKELEQHDAKWAVAGNAGGIGLGQFALRISDPHGLNARIGPFPARIASLDENFIVVKRSARISLSSDLAGFHFYGTDICVIADILGYSSYVIDFHLKHLGKGIINESFHQCRRALIEKYARAFRPRWIQTTCARVFISGATFAPGVEGLWRLAKIAGPRKLAKAPAKLARMIDRNLARSRASAEQTKV